MIILRQACGIAMAVFALGLNACDVAAPARTVEAARSAPPAAPATQARAPAASSHNAETPGANGMDKTCEGITYRITEVENGSAGPDALRNTSLSRIDASGAAKSIAKPEEMTDYTAVGLGCAVAKADGKPYFVVQFGELPFGCQFCEWFYLYDADGNQMTRSQPPLLTDESLPEAEQQSPNTREYEQAIQKLEITHPELAYLK